MTVDAFDLYQAPPLSCRFVRPRRDHIESHGEYDVDEYQQSANEPR